MKRQHRWLPLFAALLAISWCVTSCNRDTAKDELAHNHNHEHGAHDHGDHAGHDHGDGDEITVEPEVALRFGVKVEKAKLAPFNEVIKVTGEVEESAEGSGVVSAPVTGTIKFAPGITAGRQVSAGALIATVTAQNVSGGDPNRAAKAALDAAKAEMDRLKPLHDRGIVSTAEYNRAVADYETARASYSPVAASGRATAPVSGVITDLLVSQGQIVQMGEPIANISGSTKLTLRADLPDKYYNLRNSLTSAKIRPNYSDAVIDLAGLGAKRVNSTSTASSRPGYLPVYFTFDNNGSFVPGSMVEVYLIGNERPEVLTVPVSALSEQQGQYFVYIQLDEEGYVKSPVKLGTRDGERVEVLSGVHPGDNVVVNGVTTVRLSESSGVVPEGHSHNH